MATTYKATSELNCWKQHLCHGCGGIYRYLLTRKLMGKGASPEAASRALHAQLELASKEEVDLRPCPHCGLFQPEMVNSRRRAVHTWTMLLMLCGPVALGYVFVRFALLPDGQLSNLLAGCAAVALAANLLVLLRNPNRDLEANLKDSRKQVDAGELMLDKAGAIAPGSFVPVAEKASPRRRLAVGLLLLSVLGAAAPELLHILCHWEFNPSAKPTLVGPGERFSYTLPWTIDSAAGYWGGTATCTWVNAEELGVHEPCDVQVPSAHWGDSIQSRGSVSREVSPWVNITLPGNPALVGKTGRFQVSLQVRYPKVVAPSRFVEAQDSTTQAFSVTFSSRGASNTYETVWWLGVLVSFAAGLLGSFMLWNSTFVRQDVSAN
ncbi:hypothetical protein D7X96_03355 [Corallococcus interemptor]|uniref:Uncharacterized protein n=1 Tax=Corallococcus interemptor TaxID=2316720 RepID=A0A3A8R767_9BACT|nr:hypothetical protein [Corallococcus interemptor]RKH73102.1 hypothetical protein D7X96_03355 [Corallococcus interemptor]